MTAEGKPRIAIPLPTSTDLEYNEQSWSQYAAAVERSGGEPVAIALDQDPSEMARRIASCSAALLPGSPADIDPQRYGAEPHPSTAPRDALREAADELLLQDAFNLHKPLLGICYGHQSMNVWKGGTLVQHLETSVNHSPGRTIAEAHLVSFSEDAHHLQAAFSASAGQVNSSHHQAVLTPGDGLHRAAYVPEDGVIEAVEAADGYVLGVQWHPERTFEASASSRKIFSDFVRAAREWRLPAVTPEAAEKA